MKLTKYISVSTQFEQEIVNWINNFFHECKKEMYIQNIIQLADIPEYILKKYTLAVEGLYSWSKHELELQFLEKIDSLDSFSKTKKFAECKEHMSNYIKELMVWGILMECLFETNDNDINKIFCNFRPSFSQKKKETMELFIEKNKEYAVKFFIPTMDEKNPDVLFNFKAANEIVGTESTPEFVLVGYLLKHCTSIVNIFSHNIYIFKRDCNKRNELTNFIQFKEVYSNLLKEKFNDHFVYLHLLYALLTEEK